MKHFFVDNMRGFQRRIDGKHYAPYSKALLFHADGTKYDKDAKSLVCRDRSIYGPTLKQGSVAMFNGTSSECSLGSAIALQGNWSMMITFNPSVLNVLQYLCSEVITSPTRRFYVTIDANGKVSLQIGTGAAVAISGTLTLGATYTLYMSYDVTAGVITSKLRTRSTGALADLTNYTVAGLDATTGTFRIGRATTTNWYSGRMNEFYVWKSIKTVAQMDSTKTDAELAIPFCDSVLDVAGNYTVNNANITYQNSDYASFYCKEYGFAVKSGVIYPALLDGTGYAGLVGAADKYFPRGLISRRGSIDIEAWNYLDTLIDFGGSSGVLSAGIIINQFDGTDCNDDLITTAEPKLDPAEIAILVPSAGAKLELDKNFTVSGTSNCANVKIEASADGTTWVTLAASVAVSAGAFSKAACQLPSADFDPNDEVTIRVSDVDSISLPDTVAIDTIATITITPAIGNQTAGVAFDVAGTTNLPDGAEVEVFAGATSKGDATVASGAFTKSVTIADPANDVIIKVQDKLNANANDTEEIDVASGESTINFFTIDSSRSVIYKRLKSDLSYNSKSSAFSFNPYKMDCDDIHLYIACGTEVQKRLKSDFSLVASTSVSMDIACAVCVDKNHFYVAVRNDLRVIKFLKSDMSEVARVGNSYSAPFNGNNDMRPDDVAVDDTYLYVFDSFNHRIVKRLKSNLSYVSKIGSKGAGDNQFNSSVYNAGLAVDDNYIYVADNGNNRIKKHLKSDLSYHSQIGSLGTGNDQFNNPQDVAVGGGFIFIIDTDNNRIVKRLASDLSYDSKKSPMGGDDNFVSLIGIAVEPNLWD